MVTTSLRHGRQGQGGRGWPHRLAGSLIVVCLAATLLVAVPVVPGFGPKPAQAGPISNDRVSVSSSGEQASGSSPAVSADGRFVAFVSNSTVLAPGGRNQVFLRDRQAGTTVLMSAAASGAPGNGASEAPAVSADGRFVAFASTSSDLVVADLNGHKDIFVRNVAAATTSLVSVSSGGTQASDVSFTPSISGDGNRVAFGSKAQNLVPLDTNRFTRDDVFVRDQAASTTVRVSVKPGSIAVGSTHCRTPCTPEHCAANPGDCNANKYEFMEVALGRQAISADGRSVVFRGGWGLGAFSSAPCTGTYIHRTVFVVDVDSAAAGARQLAEVADGCNGVPAISGDGSTIAFLSPTGLDYFRTGPGGGALARVARETAPNAGLSHPVLSHSGDRLAFSTTASNLVLDDANGREDVYVFDGLVASIKRLSVSPTGGPSTFPVAGGSSHPALAANGALVAFASVASDLVDGDTNSASDVFVREAGIIGGPIGPGEVLGGHNPSELCGEGIACHADPVDSSTGNFFRTFEDLSVPGRGVPLSFSHTYNSAQAGVDGPLGWGWTHPYNMSLVVSGTSAVISQENASQVRFSERGGRYVPAAPRVLASLVHHPDGTWTFTRRNREIISFDAAGKLVSLADRNGETTTVAYPDAATVVVSDPAGRTLVLAHSGGRLVSVTDPSTPQRVVSFAYDAAGNLAEVVDVNGGRAIFGYYVKNVSEAESHLLLTMRSPRYATDTTTVPAPVVTNRYDGLKRIIAQTDPLGRTTSFDYYLVPGSVVVTDPKGNATLDTYAEGLLVAQTKGYGTPAAATWRFRYDPATVGLVAVTDPNGHTRTSTYDAAGNRTSSTDALGRTTSATYNGFDQPLTVTDGDGVTTTHAYDAAGNRRSSSTPLLDDAGATVSTSTVSYHYDDAAHTGDLTALTDPMGKRWGFAYNANGDVQARTAPPTPENPAGNTTTFDHNGIGWLTAMVSPRGNLTGADPQEFRTTFDHDPWGRVTVTRGPLWDPAAPEQHQSVRHYDPDGNVDFAVDGNGNRSEYYYDAAGLLTTVRRADGTKLTSRYWPDGSLQAQFDGASRATNYTYDPLGRLASVTDPLGRATTYGYDPAGNLVFEATTGGNCKASPSTGCTTMAYDAADQLVAIDYSDAATPDVTNVIYDDSGRRTSMVDGTGTSTWEWDSLGRMEASTDGAGAAVAYGYDLAGRVTALDYPGTAGVVSRTYDDAGRWDSVTDWLGNTTTFGYDADGNLATQAYPNATTTTYDIDPAGRLMALGHAADATPASPFAHFAYDRDGNDQLATVASTGVPTDDHTYGYSALNQLESLDASSYDYDAADNLTQLADGTFQAFDAANQLCHVATSAAACASPPPDATTFSYDDRGNRTGTTSPDGASDTFTYDQADRLATAAVDAGTILPGSLGTGLLGAEAAYAYNGDGLRMATTTTTGTTAFAWDHSGSLPLLLSEGTGATSSAYVYGPGGMPVERIDALGNVAYYHADQLGSTRALTDSTGNVAATYTYGPFGTLTASTGHISQPFGFAGQYTDAETGLQYLRARYYDPATGQFLTRDPLEAITQEPYGYVGNDPLNRIDPAGLAEQPLVLSPAEQAALDARRRGDPVTDPKAYKRAMKKKVFNEKLAQERNRQKRQSNFSTPPSSLDTLSQMRQSGFPAQGPSGNYCFQLPDVTLEGVGAVLLGAAALAGALLSLPRAVIFSP